MTVQFQDFADLQALRDTLHAASAEQEKRSRRAAAAAAQAEREENLFCDAIGAAAQLTVDARATHRLAPPEPIARQREREVVPEELLVEARRIEGEVLAESLSNTFDPDATVLKSDEALPWLRDPVSHELRTLQRSYWGHLGRGGPEPRADRRRPRHSQRLPEPVDQAALCCVHIDHGKGLGSARKQPGIKWEGVRWLMQKEEEMAFSASRESGGGGALKALF